MASLVLWINVQGYKGLVYGFVAVRSNSIIVIIITNGTGEQYYNYISCGLLILKEYVCGNSVLRFSEE